MIFYKNYDIIVIENKKRGKLNMYRLTQEQIKNMVYSQTPIDTIVSTHDLPGGNGIEVRGYAGGDSMTYRFYDNGKVVEK